jgi:hypothetical protein
MKFGACGFINGWKADLAAVIIPLNGWRKHRTQIDKYGIKYLIHIINLQTWRL